MVIWDKKSHTISLSKKWCLYGGCLEKVGKVVKPNNYAPPKQDNIIIRVL